MTSPDKKRIEFIDLAKGLCIILVVAYHCGLVDTFPGAKQLRMPLYFVLSGIFFKDYGKYSILKKINKLVIPFITFFALGDIFYYISHLTVNIPEIPKSYPIIDFLWGGTPSNLPIWFLLCLFNCYIIFLIIYRISKSEFQRFILVLAATFLGYIFSCHNIRLLFYIDSALTCTLFFYIGFLLKKTNFLQAENPRIKDLISAICLYLIAFSIIAYFPNNKISVFDNNIYGSPILSYFISIIIVLSILLLCKSIKYIPYISYIGRYSIIILLIHVPIMEIIYYLQKNILHISSPIIKTAATVFIASAFIPCLKKIAPKVTAQKDLISTEKFQAIVDKLFRKINPNTQ